MSTRLLSFSKYEFPGCLIHFFLFLSKLHPWKTFYEAKILKIHPRQSNKPLFQQTYLITQNWGLLFTERNILNNFGIKISRLYKNVANKTIINQLNRNNPMQNPFKNLNNLFSALYTLSLNYYFHKFFKTATFLIYYLKYFFNPISTGCDISDIAFFTSRSRFASNLKTAIIRIIRINSQRIIVKYPKVFWNRNFFCQKFLK